MNIGPERLRIYANHLEDLKVLLEPYGWFYPPAKNDKGKGKPRGLLRDSIRILYVFRKLVDTAGEVNAIHGIYKAIKDLHDKRNRKNQAGNH